MNLQLLGNRILIELEKETTTSSISGVEIPSYVMEETDGGKLRAKTQALGYLPIGTVLNISPLAAQDSSLAIGDKVLVAPAVLTTDSYNFQQDRTKRVTPFSGVISIPSSLVEAKVIE